MVSEELPAGGQPLVVVEKSGANCAEDSLAQLALHGVRVRSFTDVDIMLPAADIPTLAGQLLRAQPPTLPAGLSVPAVQRICCDAADTSAHISTGSIDLQLEITSVMSPGSVETRAADTGRVLALIASCGHSFAALTTQAAHLLVQRHCFRLLRAAADVRLPHCGGTSSWEDYLLRAPGGNGARPSRTLLGLVLQLTSSPEACTADAPPTDAAPGAAALPAAAPAPAPGAAALSAPAPALAPAPGCPSSWAAAPEAAPAVLEQAIARFKTEGQLPLPLHPAGTDTSVSILLYIITDRPWQPSQQQLVDLHSQDALHSCGPSAPKHAPQACTFCIGGQQMTSSSVHPSMLAASLQHGRQAASTLSSMFTRS